LMSTEQLEDNVEDTVEDKVEDTVAQSNDATADAVQVWQLPGVSGDSVLERKFKILNPVDLKKQAERERLAKEEKLKAELEKGFTSGLMRGKDEAFKTESVKLKEKIASVNQLITNLDKNIKE